MRWRVLSILSIVALSAVGVMLVLLAISFADPFYFARSIEKTETRILLLSGRIYWISAEQGGYLVDSRYVLDDFEKDGLVKYRQAYLTSPPAATNVLGFGHVGGKDAEGRAYSVTVIPFWLSLLLATPLLFWVFELRERHRRFDRLLCLNCGYDIRESCKQCPKCGWIMPYELALQVALKHSARDQARERADNPNPRHLDPLILQMQPPEIRPHRGNGKATR